MSNTNDINKIFVDSNIQLESVNIINLLFNDGKAISKKKYSIVDNVINNVDECLETLCFYQTTNQSDYFEYEVFLSTPNTIISGFDFFMKTPTNLSACCTMVFVNGIKLFPNEYEIVNDTSIKIFNSYTPSVKSTVIIVASPALDYLGQVTQSSSWRTSSQSLLLYHYALNQYVFFINGKHISPDKISLINDRVTINVPYRYGVDIIDYFKLPTNTSGLFFEGRLGLFSFGPQDYYSTNVPDVYDTIVTFDDTVRLLIDNVRKGFLIKENEYNGSMMIIDNTFENLKVRCIKIHPFTASAYTKDQYFVQVPECVSITKYISEYDLQGALLPEILTIFQKVLLNETQDSICRLRDLRSISKIDSSNIGNLIHFLGLNIDITKASLREKHQLLEEITNFYKIAGTRASYNFYNVGNHTGVINKLEQLFTPSKDQVVNGEVLRRYVTFKTAEELGAVAKRAYEFPQTRYGHVYELANQTDSFTNMPRREGVLTNPSVPPILHTTRKAFVNNPDGTTTETTINVNLNTYVVEPDPGPNTFTESSGSVAEVASSFISYGNVLDTILGKWIEWIEWDRPSNWYPTNHVNIDLNIPETVSYDDFMKEFKKTFYNISSTVLYIHNMISVYTYGGNTKYKKGDVPTFGIMTAPMYNTQTYCFSNDPKIQPLPPL